MEVKKQTVTIQYLRVVPTGHRCYCFSVSGTEFCNVSIICYKYLYFCAFVHMGYQNLSNTFLTIQIHLLSELK